MRPRRKLGARVLAVVTAAAFVATAVPTVAAAQELPPPRGSVACPAPVPPAAFVDARDGVHATAIACAAAHGLTLGTTPTTYQPARAVTRGQTASFLVRLADRAGVELPAARSRFGDVAGSPHRAAIERLAAAGVVVGTSATTFHPNRPVTRAQTATLLVRLLDLAELDLPGDRVRFADVTGGPHRDAIERLAGAGIVLGTTSTTFAPSRDLTRAQYASLLTGVLDRFVAAGRLTVPWLDPDRPTVTWRLEPSSLLLAPGERGAFDVVGLDAFGQPTSARPDEVSVDVVGGDLEVTRRPADGRLEVGSDVATTAGLAVTVTAAGPDGPAATSVVGPAWVTVAALADGVRGLGDDAIAFPPADADEVADAAEGVAPASATRRTVQAAIVDELDLGPFTPLEAAAAVRFRPAPNDRDDELEELASFPLITRGAAVPVGTIVVGTEATPLVARVTDLDGDLPPVRRGDHWLHAAAPVSLAEAFDDLVVDLEHDDLVALRSTPAELAGCFGACDALTATSATADAVARRAIAARPDASAASTSATATAASAAAAASYGGEVCPSGDAAFAGIVVDPALRVELRPSFDVRVDVRNQRYRIDAGADATGSFTAGLRAGLAGSYQFECRIVNESRTLPMPPLLAFVAGPYVGYALPLRLDIDVAGGPSFTVRDTCTARLEGRAGASYSPEAGLDAYATSPSHPTDCTRTASADALGSEAGVSLSAELALRAEAGVEPGGPIARIARLLPTGGIASRISGQVPILFVEAGHGAEVALATDRRVAATRSSDARVVGSLYAAWGLDNGSIVAALARFSPLVEFAASVEVPAVRVPIVYPGGFVGLTDERIGLSVDGASPTEAATVAVGQQVELAGAFDHVDAGTLTFTPTTAERAEVWRHAGSSVERSDLFDLTTEGMTFSGELTVTEELCDDELAQPVDLTVVGANRAFGTLLVPGYGGTVTLGCDRPSLRFVPPSVALDGRDGPATGTSTLTVDNLTGGTLELDGAPDWLEVEVAWPAAIDAPVGSPQQVEVGLTGTCPEVAEDREQATLTARTVGTELDDELEADLEVELRCDADDDPGDPGEPPAPAGPSAGASGDPHLWTFDGLAYDLQAGGEFWLVRSTEDGFAVQVGFDLDSDPDRRFSIVQDVAVVLPGGEVLTRTAQGTAWMRGEEGLVEPTVLPDGTWVVGDDVRLSDGTTVRGGSRHVQVTLAAARRGAVTGLLGDADGDAVDDGRTADGRPLFGADVPLPEDPDVLRDLLYEDFARGWEVAVEDRRLPRARVPFSVPAAPLPDLDPSDEELLDTAGLCVAAGITAEPGLTWCIYDVLLTGDPTFATAGLYPTSTLIDAGNSPRVAGPTRLLGVPDDGTARIDELEELEEVRYLAVVPAGSVLVVEPEACRSIATTAQRGDVLVRPFDVSCEPRMFGPLDVDATVDVLVENRELDPVAVAATIVESEPVPLGEFGAPAPLEAGTARVFRTDDPGADRILAWRAAPDACLTAGWSSVETRRADVGEPPSVATHRTISSQDGCDLAGLAGGDRLLLSALFEEVAAPAVSVGPVAVPARRTVALGTAVTTVLVPAFGDVPVIEVPLTAGQSVDVSAVSCPTLPALPSWDRGRLQVRVDRAPALDPGLPSWAERSYPHGELTQSTDGAEPVPCRTFTFTADADGAWPLQVSGPTGVEVTLAVDASVAGDGDPSARASTVAAGGGHTCAVIDGAVVCTGRNTHGQLGAAGPATVTTPVPVAGLPAQVVGVAAGDDHTCAVTADGELWCWGRNHQGQLGDGGFDDRHVPAPVVGGVLGRPEGFADVVAVDAGGATTCAVHAGGQVSCWGGNLSGQGGVERGSSAWPGWTAVTAAVDVAVGAGTTCALHGDGYVSCFGANFAGQAGQPGAEGGWPPDLALPYLPHHVAGVSGAADVTVGALFGCAVTTSVLRCWGDPGTGDGPAPAPVALPDGAVPSRVVASQDHACLTVTSGRVICFGDNSSGQLGTGETGYWTPPTLVDDLAASTDVAAGDGHSCAIDGGEVWCWGRNHDGQLGDGSVTPSSSPVRWVSADPPP
ncbi:hypothetical protein FTX61_04625 [Nitriliruptoraceae bacterium ZYF776]|nr:hypothetical protein [Profundirhabdus halotolerans]